MSSQTFILTTSAEISLRIPALATPSTSGLSIAEMAVGLPTAAQFAEGDERKLQFDVGICRLKVFLDFAERGELALHVEIVDDFHGHLSSGTRKGESGKS